MVPDFARSVKTSATVWRPVIAPSFAIIDRFSYNYGKECVAPIRERVFVRLCRLGEPYDADG